MERDSTQPRYVKQSISFPTSQLVWLREEARRQDHGNLSRVVQDAIREYRKQRMVEQIEWSERQLERIA